jgi:serine/threonine protein kinase
MFSQEIAPKTTRATMRQGGTLIFTRKREIAEENVRLQDFQIKKIIGKGAFGKVFLVQHRKT